jgi:DNA-directed RNA polymerase N-terminal
LRDDELITPRLQQFPQVNEFFRLSRQQVLKRFHPHHPPNHDPVRLQLWMECEAHQEALEKYQRVIADARERHDYGSLSVVQRQVVRWFPPLQQLLQERQRQYLTNDKKEPTAETDNNMDCGKARKKYGPFLCRPRGPALSSHAQQ